ncbi:MAG: S8 family serine peptidase [Candidatus Electryonea clarkiae]|nr:S8 family serine peptidase [Candidatus Electryonea clarkiae]
MKNNGSMQHEVISTEMSQTQFESGVIELPEGQMTVPIDSGYVKIQDVLDTLIYLEADSLERLYTTAVPGETIYYSRIRKKNVTIYDLSQFYIIHLDKEASIDDAISVLNSLDETNSAEPSVYVTLEEEPDDTYYELDSLWYLNNDSHPSCDIDAPEAWEITHADGINIAFIESGMEINHVDLRSSICYDSVVVDTIVDGEDTTFVYETLTEFVHHYQTAHGTNTAGIACATTNNDTGVSGVAWGAKIVVREFWTTPDTVLDAVEGRCRDVLRCAQLGVRIINNSWSHTSNLWYMNYSFDVAHSLGAVMVCSQGNIPARVIKYPAAYSQSQYGWVISCSWLKRTGGDSLIHDHNATYADYCDITAPGRNLYTTFSYDTTSYDLFSGSSASAPVVAGVAALVMARFPSITDPDSIK